ncbi:MAG: Hsp20/alpha crystallin family protein, partial [Acidobacteriota bacterium]
ERLFAEALELIGDRADAAHWRPAIDVVETTETVQVLVEVPGIGQDDLRVEIEGTTLLVTGTKTPSSPGEQARYHRLERGRGGFERTVDLVGPVNTHEAVARLHGGLLTVELPKIREKRKRRRILVIEEDEGDETS